MDNPDINSISGDSESRYQPSLWAPEFARLVHVFRFVFGVKFSRVKFPLFFGLLRYVRLHTL